MKATVEYFGMIAEILNQNNEEIILNFDKELNLRTFFENKYSVLQSLQYKIAINSELNDTLKYSENKVKIALLPPFAGG